MNEARQKERGQHERAAAELDVHNGVIDPVGKIIYDARKRASPSA